MGSSIEVELKGGRICRVDPVVLDLLLSRDEIAKFKRANGWAVIGRDSVRDSNKGLVYSIPERRQAF